MHEKKTSVVKVGLINFSLRILSSPLSFAFSYIVAHHLSGIDLELFGLWQSVFIYITGLFAIPSNALGYMTSKLAAEGKPVGLLVLLNLALGGVSGLVYVLAQPLLVPQSANIDPRAVELAVVMVLLYYALTASNAVAKGRTPMVIGASATAFQVVRLAFLLIAFFVWKMTILGVVLAYSLGYFTQIMVNLFFVRANLGVEREVLPYALKGSLVLSVAYFQYILEAGLVWFANVITQSTVPASYFESATIITNVVLWSAALYSGVIKRVAETREPSVLVTALKLVASVGMLAVVLDLDLAYPLLYYIRPEYTASLVIAFFLALSNYTRMVFMVYYEAFTVFDEGLGKTLKSLMGKMLVSNIFYAAVPLALGFTAIAELHTMGPIVLGVIMASVMLTDSVLMTRNAQSLARKNLGVRFPWDTYLRSALVAALTLAITFPFSISSSIAHALVIGVASLALYVAFSYFLNPYARTIITRSVREVKTVIISRADTHSR